MNNPTTGVEIGEDTLTRRRRQQQENAPFRVVLVDDDFSILRLVQKVLASTGIEVIACPTGMEGLDALENREWDLCLLDRQLPDMNGMDICRRIKAESRFDTRQVIILSACTSTEDKVEAFGIGADDYITKPFEPVELVARVHASRRVVEMQKQLVDMARQLEELSARDSLTGMFNRRHFGMTLEQAFNHSERYQRPLSVALIDVDCFKTINDSFGHQTGDQVLAELARRFAKSVRASDYVARYGGEEFVVLLPETVLEDAVRFGEKLRTSIAAAPVCTADGTELPVTVSVGTASLAHTHFRSSSEMIAAADQALYRAKRNGRNRVEAERRRTQRDGNAPGRLSAARASM
ncbi:MAG TPA: diguanylate cyclase [Thermoanaerobaculia bacterium]|jgi:diguanylate cyclase (GGDEF)-like protein|nr:diguanylate cyclase [Thermoanaerobaculia bacterium]